MSAWLLLYGVVLVDVVHFVIVLFQSGVFEYIFFCVREVVATPVSFGSCSRLRYRVVSDWGVRVHYILCPRCCC